jgi:hypothetical protein
MKSGEIRRPKAPVIADLRSRKAASDPTLNTPLSTEAAHGKLATRIDAAPRRQSPSTQGRRPR